MKKILLFIIAAAMLVSCGGPKLTSRVVTSSLLDFRGYAEQGFLVSPYVYTSDYEAIGELNIYVRPANVKVPDPQSDFNIKVIIQEDISNQELADIAVEEAKKTGADALVNFDIKQLPVSLDSRDIYYIISGFCIKRR